MTEWYYSISEKQYGPVSRSVIVDAIDLGQIPSDALFWTETFGAEWRGLQESGLLTSKLAADISYANEPSTLIRRRGFSKIIPRTLLIFGLTAVLSTALYYDHKKPLFPDAAYCLVGAGRIYNDPERFEPASWQYIDHIRVPTSWQKISAESTCVHGSIWQAVLDSQLYTSISNAFTSPQDSKEFPSPSRTSMAPKTDIFGFFPGMNIDALARRIEEIGSFKKPTGAQFDLVSQNLIYKTNRIPLETIKKLTEKSCSLWDTGERLLVCSFGQNNVLQFAFTKNIVPAEVSSVSYFYRDERPSNDIIKSVEEQFNVPKLSHDPSAELPGGRRFSLTVNYDGPLCARGVRCSSVRIDVNNYEREREAELAERRSANPAPQFEIPPQSNSMANTSPKMSVEMWGQLDGYMIEQYKRCWTYRPLGPTLRYIPQIEVSFTQAGGLRAEPRLRNQPSDPNSRALAESAIRAVKQCNPLGVPAQFKPYYNEWRDRIMRFDPDEMAG